MNKNIRTATIENCSYRKCDNTYKRYAYQIKKGTGFYCSQSCASKESIARQRDNTSGRYSTSKEDTPCIYCKKNISKTQSRYCKECYNIKQRINKFNITMEQYHELLIKQNNSCGICKMNRCSTGRSFAIDHDHSTGKVRGLLCYKCNTSVGWYENKKNNLYEYFATIV